MDKQYGLIMPDKNGKPAPSFRAFQNVFGDDSDSDEDRGKKRPMLRASVKFKKQDRILQEEALNEDPTIFQYDEIYDDLEIKKNEGKSASKVVKKPKYIEKLLESANKRKRENERRMERQVQKEREKEGDEFADKESFVTNAYKQKLEELRAEEEKEKREEYLEKIGDVTKQQDLGGFYRHLYEQKMGKEDKSDDKIQKDLQENEDIKLENDDKGETKAKVSRSSSPKKQRNYRKREASQELLNHELSEGEIVSEEETKLSLEDIKASKRAKNDESNPDADSDFATESSTSEDEMDDKNEGEKSKDQKTNDAENANYMLKSKTTNKKANKRELKSPSAENETLTQKSDTKNKKMERKESIESDIKNKVDVKEKSPPKPKINIWEKRTVGILFEEALKRYYERKSARSR